MLTTKKEKMNTEEEVNKAARHYAEVQYGDPRKSENGMTEDFDNCVEFFEAGAKWQQSQSADVAMANVTPFQTCPKCNGQGMVSKPPYIAGDVHQWSSTSASFVCDVCNGSKIIPTFSDITVKSAKINRETKQGEFLIEVGDKDEEIKRLREVLNDCISACKYAANNFDAGYDLSENVIETTSPVGSLLIAARNAEQSLNPKG